VRAPLHCSNKIIEKAVENDRDWILRRQKYEREHCKPAFPKKYITGEEFLYLGKSYKLIISATSGVPLIFTGINFVLTANYAKNARELFIQWYSKEAFRIISDRANLYSYITGMKYKKLRISNAQHRWGSCSAKGNLNFSWSLIMAPLEVIDYVIVHELIHIKIKGHSKDFWQKVSEFIPEYILRRKWLNENQNLLTL